MPSQPGQGLGGSSGSAGQLPHSVPAAVGSSQRVGEAACLCCLLPLLSLCLSSERHKVLLFLWSAYRQEEEEGGEGGGTMGWRQVPWHKAVLFVLTSLAVSFGKKSEHESVCLPSSQNSLLGWKFSSTRSQKEGKHKIKN